MKNVYNHFICVTQNILDLLSNKTVAAMLSVAISATWKNSYLWWVEGDTPIKNVTCDVPPN